MNILLVDDEQLSLENLEMIVSNVYPSANRAAFTKASKVLEYIQTASIDIAFLDIQMRGIDGLTIAKILKEHNPKVNILFCTGYSDYSLEAWNLNSSGYLLKPITEEKVRNAVANLRYPVEDKKRVQFVCFGNFEVYCDSRPICFKYNRTKEMLAYLVDRKGAACSMKEVEAVLFEDDQHRSYMYQIRLDLVNTLTELGIDDILVQSRGHLGIDPEKVSCDYYDYLDGKLEVPVKEYMSQFSFSEITYATLFMG